MENGYEYGYEINSTTPIFADRHGKKLPQYIAALSVSMGALAAGAVLGWTGNISDDMITSSYNGIKIDDHSLGWIGAIATIGATVACFPVGTLCDILGRKTTMMLLTLPLMIGWICIIFAKSLTMLYIGRFLTGMAGCAFCVAAPIYTSEIAEKEIRGALGSYFELFLTTGILLAYVVPLYVNLKIHTLTMALLPLIFAIVFWYQPESPVYLLKQNHEQEARAALVHFRGRAYDVDAEIRKIKYFIEEEANNNTSLCESLSKRGTKRAMLVCFSLMFFQQACGVTALVFYCESIFESAGSKFDPKVCTVIIGTVHVAATFLSSIVVDKLGKRFLLFVSLLFVAISGAVLAMYFTLEERHLVSEATIAKLSFVPIASLSVFVIMFSLGLGPIPWTLTSELFLPEIKSFGTGAATTLNWFTSFLVAKFYLDVRDTVGGDVTFYIFSSVSLIGAIFTYCYVPETKGKTLEKILQELNRQASEEEVRTTYITLTC